MRILFTPYIYIPFFLLAFQSANSQKISLEFTISDGLKNNSLDKLFSRKSFGDESRLYQHLDTVQLKLERFGFLNYSVDSLKQTDSIYRAYITLGKSIKSIKVYYDNNILKKEMLSTVSDKVEESYFQINFSEIPDALNYITDQFINSGWPFTKLFLTNINFNSEQIEASLFVEVSSKRNIDKIIIRGYDDFPKNYLNNVINLKSSTFDANRILEISNTIKTIPFVSEKKPAEILFTNDSTYLYLNLQKEKANRFDGLIGFASQENSNRLNFNGYIDLELVNALNSGERLYLNWKNNANNRQLFNFGFELPYVFNSRFTPSLGFNIYKQDSTFINTKTNLALKYRINSRQNFKVFYLFEDSRNLLINKNIEDLVDFNSYQIGLNYSYLLSNNNSLFRDKFNVVSAVSFGSRKALELITPQYVFSLDAQYIWSLNLKNHIFIRNQSSLLFSDDYLTNELFRIGGINSIRGFNEESIFTSNYSFFNLEYRYVTNVSSYLYSISDIGFINNDILKTSQNIYSLGLGYKFKSSIGIIDISYALGGLEDQALNFNSSRFHVKITNFF